MSKAGNILIIVDIDKLIAVQAPGTVIHIHFHAIRMEDMVIITAI